MKRAAVIIVGLLLGGAGLVYWRRPEAPEAPCAQVRRASLVQMLTTNGKVDALDSMEVHARVPVQVTGVRVEVGDHLRRGQLLADVDETSPRQSLDRARAQLEVARVDRAVVERGGTAVEIAEIESALNRARLDREAAEREVVTLQRLVERQAASRAELLEQQQRLVRAQAQVSALERKRQALLGPEDRERVQARIREADAAVAQAETQLRQTEIRAPTEGILYFLALKPGGYYNAGALVARVGVMHSVRVRLLVDEPELGPVQVGQPVRITWDALPGTSWHGEVERLPSMVETIGTRTVGEVICTIDTPFQRLLPNVTVNVEIRTGAADDALTIPREAVVREGEQTLVLVVGADGVIVRRPVRLGIHDLARVQVLQGLSENQVVVLPGERSFAAGQKVRPKVAT